MMYRAILSLVLTVVITSFAYTQDYTLNVKAGQAQLVKNATGLIQIGDSIYLKQRFDQMEYQTVGLVKVETEAQTVIVKAMYWTKYGPRPVEVEKVDDIHYRITEPGSIWVQVRAINQDPFFFDEQDRVIVIGKSPDPDDDDPDDDDTDPDDDDTDPDDDPDDDDPDPPIPDTGLHILMIYESSEYNKLKPQQKEIVESATNRQYLNQVTNGNFRWLDQHTNYTDPENKWRKALERPRDSLPWMIISNGVTGFEGSMPNSMEELKGTIEIYKPK